jgi:hypothetical protein
VIPGEEVEEQDIEGDKQGPHESFKGTEILRPTQFPPQLIDEYLFKGRDEFLLAHLNHSICLYPFLLVK